MGETFHVTEFVPKKGKTVELGNPQRQHVVRGPQAAGGSQPLAVVVSTGEPAEYVVRSTTESTVELGDGDVVLGVEPPANTHRDTRLWFCSPTNRYGGGD